MKHVIVFIVVLFAAAPAARAQQISVNTVQGQMLVTMPVETRALKGAPYSAEIATDSTQTLSDGNRIVQHSTGRVYRDREGRVRREEDRPSGTPAISIVDPVAGVSYSLDPESRIAWKSTTRASEEVTKEIVRQALEARRESVGRGAAPPTPGSDEAQRLEEERRKVEAEVATARMGGGGRGVGVGGGRVGGGRGRGEPGRGGVEQHSDEQLAPRQMEGVRVEGHRTTTTIAAGAIGNEQPIKIVSEEWVSPELKVLVMTQRKDPRSGDSSYRLLNVIPRDPDPSLFQVPGDYTIKETGIRRLESRREQ